MDRPRQRLRSILETLHHGPYLKGMERDGLSIEQTSRRSVLPRCPSSNWSSFTSALVHCSEELQSNKFLKTGLGFESR
jgi:hypothetical protein